MKLATQNKFCPILIASDSWKDFLDLLCELSPSLKSENIKPSDWSIADVDCIRLDVGGMFWAGDPFELFEIDGVKFSVQLGRADVMLEIAKNAEGNRTRIPGWRRFLVWGAATAIPEVIYNKLLIELERLAKSDLAYERALGAETVFDKLSNDGVIKRLKGK